MFDKEKHMRELREASLEDCIAIADCISVLSDDEKDALIVALIRHALVFQHALWNKEHKTKGG